MAPRSPAKVRSTARRVWPACLALGIGCAAPPASTPRTPPPRGSARAELPTPRAAAAAPMPVPHPGPAPAPPPVPTQACAETDAGEVCKRACDAGFIASCLRYGRMRQTPRPGPYDPREAGAAFEKACDAGEAAGCDALGLFYEGAALERDDPKAAALYRKACDAGLASGCGHLAILRFQGEPGVEATTPGEIAAALALLTKACKDGHANSCSFLGGLYFVGKRVTKDIRKARSLSEKGCEMGDFRGCEAAGLQWALNWDGAPMHQGRAVGYQMRAFEMVKKKCAETGEFCGKLAEYYRTGHGGAPDEDRAIAVLDDACHTLKSSAACSDLGLLYQDGKRVKQDFVQAFQLFEMGCDGNITTACFELGRHYHFGLGVPKDLPKSFSFTERSCALGLAEGCDVVGTYYQNGEGVDRSGEKGLFTRRRACGWRSAMACQTLAVWLVVKEGTNADILEASRHLARACELAGGNGCFWWGLLYEKGWGVPRNPTRARELARRACKDQEQAACRWLRDPKDVPAWVKEREAKDIKKAP